MNGGFLRGKKTYVLAALAVLTALAGWATGDLTAADALQQAWAGGIAMTLRAGVAKT